jgi:hypothetical protein
MPGAPNRPPDTAAPAPPPPAGEPAEKKALRRLAPSRVALLLDTWKGNPSSELTGPYAKAESAFAAGDYPGATSALEMLSVRFAEPRWPTLPEPFRRLRVAIPAPTPPHWDPDFALPPAEKEAKRRRAYADDQLALAAGSVAWLAAHSIDAADLTTEVQAATALLGTEGPGDAFFGRIDAVWEAVRARAPAPVPAAPRTRPVPAPAAAGAEAEP